MMLLNNTQNIHNSDTEALSNRPTVIFFRNEEKDSSGIRSFEFSDCNYIQHITIINCLSLFPRCRVILVLLCSSFSCALKFYQITRPREGQATGLKGIGLCNQLWRQPLVQLPPSRSGAPPVCHRSGQPDPWDSIGRTLSSHHEQLRSLAEAVQTTQDLLRGLSGQIGQLMVAVLARRQNRPTAPLPCAPEPSEVSSAPEPSEVSSAPKLPEFPSVFESCELSSAHRPCRRSLGFRRPAEPQLCHRGLPQRRPPMALLFRQPVSWCGFFFSFSLLLRPPSDHPGWVVFVFFGLDIDGRLESALKRGVMSGSSELCSCLIGLTCV
ncbi:uncharacterized protein LOC118558206 [Fundulus heteroclitus]|uniref:uncharacterized protein LOC118558206 n=1 Tax=Fundulus heteroclitus TaxID=8078 RepID=UPI00165A2F9D|nr:uncharacterized protein LOC118558206 [Fundulus heteroclitus]